MILFLLVRFNEERHFAYLFIPKERKERKHSTLKETKKEKKNRNDKF